MPAACPLLCKAPARTPHCADCLLPISWPCWPCCSCCLLTRARAGCAARKAGRDTAAAAALAATLCCCARHTTARAAGGGREAGGRAGWRSGGDRRAAGGRESSWQSCRHAAPPQRLAEQATRQIGRQASRVLTGHDAGGLGLCGMEKERSLVSGHRKQHSVRAAQRLATQTRLPLTGQGHAGDAAANGGGLHLS